jgi:hypothetical protein
MQEVVKLGEGGNSGGGWYKRLRSSYACHDRQSALHMVSAFATANGVVMGQIKTDTKPNEITAIPDLLNLLDIKGCLILSVVSNNMCTTSAFAGVWRIIYIRYVI